MCPPFFICYRKEEKHGFFIVLYRKETHHTHFYFIALTNHILIFLSAVFVFPSATLTWLGFPTVLLPISKSKHPRRWGDERGRLRKGVERTGWEAKRAPLWGTCSRSAVVSFQLYFVIPKAFACSRRWGLETILWWRDVWRICRHILSHHGRGEDLTKNGENTGKWNRI